MTILNGDYSMKIDFHVHTRRSPDSLIRPIDLARKSAKLGVVPALADHNSIKSHADMRAMEAPFIPAEEIFTDKGDLIGLHISELIPKNTPFLEAIDRIHDQGGIAYLPHMYDHGRSRRHAPDKEAAKVDLIETFNARCMDQSFNAKADTFARKHKLLKAAGSHRLILARLNLVESCRRLSAAAIELRQTAPGRPRPA